MAYDTIMIILYASRINIETQLLILPFSTIDKTADYNILNFSQSSKEFMVRSATNFSWLMEYGRVERSCDSPTRTFTVLP